MQRQRWPHSDEAVTNASFLASLELPVVNVLLLENPEHLLCIVLARVNFPMNLILLMHGKGKVRILRMRRRGDHVFWARLIVLDCLRAWKPSMQLSPFGRLLAILKVCVMEPEMVSGNLFLSRGVLSNGSSHTSTSSRSSGGGNGSSISPPTFGGSGSVVAIYRRRPSS